LRDEDAARLALQRGAQDYLLAERLDDYSLSKTLTGMLERSTYADALFLEKERAQVTLNSIGDAVISTGERRFVGARVTLPRRFCACTVIVSPTSS